MIRPHFHDIKFDGIPLSDFGVHISGEGTFKSADKEYETVKVPGMHGDLLIDTGRFNNVTIKYPAFIFDDFSENASNFCNFMLSRKGYCRFESTYQPDEYRLGMYKGPYDPEVILLSAGNFDIEFDMKPQRYLKLGEQVKEFTSNDKIYNPTYFDSNPLIRIYVNGTGTHQVGIGANFITVKGLSYPYIDVDCWSLDATYNGNNCNDKVEFTIPYGRDRVDLVPGENGIMIPSTVSKIEITPRWWKV